jgi:predicted XRE-type DNA-binding protein
VKHRENRQPWAPAGKLSPEDVESIRRELARAEATQRKIARAYNVHESSISRLATGKSWRVAPR